ncbi:MAG: hypothetical protein ABIH70_06655 [Chloroflexota bacterium]
MRYRRFETALLKIIVIAAFVLPVCLPASVRAAPAPVPIDLILGGGGATSWSGANLKPGDSGTHTVTLHNSGTIDGQVVIWVSDLVSIEGPTHRPGKFADYLTLTLAGRGLETNLSLPVTMKNFPQSPTAPHYVRVNPLRAGDTIPLVWKWELPPQTGNDVQGNGISFTLNYMLEEPPPPEPPDGGVGEPEPSLPPPSTLQVDLESKRVGLIVDASGTVQEAALLTDATGNFVIDVDKGVMVTGPGKTLLNRMDLTVVEGTTIERRKITELVELPKGMVVLSPTYKINGYSNDIEVSRVYFDPYIVITISYDPKDLPENALPPYIVNFTEGGSIVRLDPPPGALFEIGKAKGVVYHASYFAVVTEVSAPPAPLPPRFNVSNLLINPRETNPGQPVSISVDIANDGDTTGTYQVYLIVDGIVRSVKDIAVSPQSVTTVRFEVANLAAGYHQVRIAGLTGEFRIVSVVTFPPSSPVNWPLIDLSIIAVLAVASLVSYLIIRRSQKSRLL